MLRDQLRELDADLAAGVIGRAAYDSARQELERRVAERTAELKLKNAELENINKLFVGRELRMVELKERIKELERRAFSGDSQNPRE